MEACAFDKKSARIFTGARREATGSFFSEVGWNVREMAVLDSSVIHKEGWN